MDGVGNAPSLPGLHIAVRSQPGGEASVGGDWYDAFELPSGEAAVIVGDTAGHGESAAIVMTKLRAALRTYLAEDPSPTRALDYLNTISQNIGPAEIATVVIAVIDRDNGSVHFASAGHVPPIIADTEFAHFVNVVKAPAIGVVPDTTYTEVVERLPRHGSVILYTDGLIERRGEVIDLGLGRLVQQAMQELPDVDKMCDRLLADLPEAEHSDDITVLAVSRSS